MTLRGKRVVISKLVRVSYHETFKKRLSSQIQSLRNVYNMLSYGDTLIYYHLKYNSLGNINRIHGICNSVVYLYCK